MHDNVRYAMTAARLNTADVAAALAVDAPPTRATLTPERAQPATTGALIMISANEIRRLFSSPC